MPAELVVLEGWCCGQGLVLPYLAVLVGHTRHPGWPGSRAMVCSVGCDGHCMMVLKAFGGQVWQS